MIGRLSLQTVRRSWPPYLGAFVALTLGVLLLSVTVTLVGSTGATAHSPGVSAADRAQLDDLSSLFGFMAAVSLFMATFVVASTFGFVVSTRRRQLGLLRLVGATPRQVRRLILGESAVVALLATVVGCAVGTLLAPAGLWLVRERGVTDLALQAPAPWVAWSIAGPCGAGVALLGSWRASRRAARTPALVALREATIERRRPSVLQCLVSLTCLTGVVVTQVLADRLDPVFALITAILLPEVVVIGLMCVGDLLFPSLAGLLARPFARRDVAAGLARDQVRTASRTTASLAAPVVAISAVAGSLVLALSFSTDWSAALDREQLRAPLVVQTDDARVASLVAASPAVATADVRTRTTLRMRIAADDTETVDVDVVDMTAAAAARGLRAVRGDLSALHGRAAAVTETWVSDAGVGLGRTVRVRIGGRVVPLRIVAVVPDAPDLYSDVLVDRALLGKNVPDPDLVFVLPARGYSARQAATALRGSLAGSQGGTAGSVLEASAWIGGVEQQTRSANAMALWVLLGPAGLYSAIALVNTVLVAASQRRRQDRTAAMLGASRRQLHRAALWEAAFAGGAGLVVGAGVTAWIGWLVGRAVVRDVPTATLTVPWVLLGGIAGTCAALVLGSALIGGTRAPRLVGG